MTQDVKSCGFCGREMVRPTKGPKRVSPKRWAKHRYCSPGCRDRAPSRGRGSLKYSDEDLLQALAVAAALLPEPLTMAAYSTEARARGWPSPTAILDRFGTWAAAKTKAAIPHTRGDRGGGYVMPSGYRVIYVDGERVLEHRHVMEKKLGRKLLPGETVHHRNGQRADNRESNLELRVSLHQRGQSVEDALEWAREILQRHA